MISRRETCSDKRVDSGETFDVTGCRDMSLKSTQQGDLVVLSDILFSIAKRLPSFVSLLNGTLA